MRFSNTLTIGTLLLSGNLALAQSIGVGVGKTVHRLEAVQVDGQTYLSLEQTARLLGLQLEMKGEDRVEVTGPGATVVLSLDRPLVQIEREYLLLNQPVRKLEGDWLLPLEFFERGLPRVLNSPVRLVAQGTRSEPNQVSIQVLNSPTRVSLVFLPSDGVESTVRETNGALIVEFQGRVQFLTPLVRPEPALVSSLGCTPGEDLSVCEIQKGIDFRSHREQHLPSPERLLLDVFSTASMTSTEEESEALEPATLGHHRRIVTIDPGHGGEDRGVSAGGVFEKDISARLAMLLAAELQNRGLVADTTRSSDFNPSLEHRSAVANGNHSSVFLSLHIGRNYSREASGPVVFTYESDESSARRRGDLIPWEAGQSKFLPDSRRLASLLQERLNRLFQATNGSSSAPLAVLAPVQSPAVLIEAGQLTNQDDSEALGRADFQHELAVSIADAIEVFLR